MAIRAAEHFNWPRSFQEDLSTDDFEQAHSAFDFDWDKVVWWNEAMAEAAQRIANERILGHIFDPIGDLRAGLTAPDGEQLFMDIVTRAPRTESRCVDHLELAIRHIIKSNLDIQGRPFMVYDVGTGTWKQEGQTLTSVTNPTIGSLIDRVITNFYMALGRAADMLYYLVDVVEPPPPVAWQNGTPAQQVAYADAVELRKKLTKKVTPVHTMAREIPRGKYIALRNGLRTRLSVKQTAWDSDTRWVVLRDGALNVDDVRNKGIIELHPFSPDHRSTMALAVGLADEVRNAGKSEWEQGVEKVLPNPEIRGYLQKRFGAALLGRPGEAGKSMVWQYGVGDTAKSTLQECIAGARGVFAPYAVVSDSAALTTAGAAKGAGERFKAYARGKRFAIMSELADGERLDQSLLKQVTGGETIEGTAKYANSVSYYFTATLFMASNHTPRLPEGDTAAVGRIHVVPFEHRLWVRSKNPDEWNAAPPEHRADEMWATRVLASPQERAAILRWVLEGLVRFGADGGIGELPQVMREARDEFAADADPVGKLVRTLLGQESDSEEPAKLKIITDAEFEAEGTYEGDYAITVAQAEALINETAKRLGMLQNPFDSAISPKWMKAALRMLHELGGAKKKVMLDRETRRTATAYTRLRYLGGSSMWPGTGTGMNVHGI